MIIDARTLPSATRLRARLVVIGAGPAGITTALEAARRGQDVILVESGGPKPDAGHQMLSRAARRNADRHAPVELAVSRQVGGTSAIWGGRCVPYDPIDFRERAITADSPWPISHKEIDQYVQRACDWMKCGRAVFDVSELPHLPREMVPGLVDGDDVLSSSIERWSLPTNFGTVYRDELRDCDALRLLTGATCVRIDVDPGAHLARQIECRTLSGQSLFVEADDIVIACGGLESTRLLLASPGPSGTALGNHSGHLGRWYMAHLEGVIADIEFDTPADATVYDYERDIDGVYVRRRFTFSEDFQLEEGLPNISAWIANPELADASHGDPRLSFTYLCLISPFGRFFAPDAQRLSLTGTNIPGTPYGMATRSSVPAHLRNLARHPVAALRFIAGFGIKRVFGRGRRPPGFFVHRPDNRYPLQYHAEHLPSPESRVRLSDEVDELGLPRLDIDIRFSDADVDGVLRAHDHLDRYLRRTGVGRLVYNGTDLAAMVRARSGGGFHQVGTTRMATDAAGGVVDENLTVHGVHNVHVVSSSAFVTSGQANSTFLIVALALRLADRLCGVQ